MKKIKLLAAHLLVFWALALVLLLTLTSCASEEEIASAPTAAPTSIFEEIKLPVHAKGAGRVGSLEFVLVYDPAVLEATKVEKGALAGNAMMEFSVKTPGRVWVGMIDAQGMSGDGPLAIVFFRVVGKGEVITPLTPEDIEAYDAETLLDIITEASPGNIAVEDRSFIAPVIAFAGE
ncbi:MAG TPA: hypothetical protein G4O02_17400 [Caldilineae bacterium]|nr:hypothetical protein [Caldilineae bacterium]